MVLIAGPCGIGKSHLAQALGHIGVRLGHHVLFTTQTQLLGSLQAVRATETFARHFQTLAQVSLLIIDDFGLKPLRPPQDEVFHDLIAERCEQAATIVANDLDFAEWDDSFHSRLLGAYRVVLDGESCRTPRPLSDAPKSPYRLRNKTDRADAEALLEAARSLRIEPVPIKSVNQQQIQLLHRLREQYKADRVARINVVRGAL